MGTAPSTSRAAPSSGNPGSSHLFPSVRRDDSRMIRMGVVPLRLPPPPLQGPGPHSHPSMGEERVVSECIRRPCNIIVFHVFGPVLICVSKCQLTTCARGWELGELTSPRKLLERSLLPFFLRSFIPSCSSLNQPLRSFQCCCGQASSCSVTVCPSLFSSIRALVCFDVLLPFSPSLRYEYHVFKLLLLGDGAVGKTRLRDCLIEGPEKTALQPPKTYSVPVVDFVRSAALPFLSTPSPLLPLLFLFLFLLFLILLLLLFFLFLSSLYLPTPQVHMSCLIFLVETPPRESSEWNSDQTAGSILTRAQLQIWRRSRWSQSQPPPRSGRLSTTGSARWATATIAAATSSSSSTSPTSPPLRTLS